MVASQQQGTATRTYGLDPLGNRILTVNDNRVTRTSHYSNNGDSPAWTSTNTGSWTRHIASVTGLAATVESTGGITLRLANLSGDLIAETTPTTSTPGGADRESTEYGVPRDAAGAPDYGWLGAVQRSTDSLGGLYLMGVRLYNPYTGRFLSRDPIRGANPNDYTYPIDPINQADTSGMLPGPLCRCGPSWFRSTMGQMAMDAGAAWKKAVGQNSTPGVEDALAYPEKYSMSKNSVYYRGTTWLYRIWFKLSKTGAQYTWKWGITSATPATSRPQGQIPKCESRPGYYKCGWHWVGVYKWRALARQDELRYCRAYAHANDRHLPAGSSVC